MSSILLKNLYKIEVIEEYILLNSKFDLCIIECLGSKKAASYEIPRELETNQGSEVFGEISGTFCTLWSRKVLTKF